MAGKDIKRPIKKQFWFSEEEEQALKKHARMTCLSEVDFIRLVVRGFLPKEKPDKEFYEALKQISAIGNNLNQMAKKINRNESIDTSQIYTEIEELKAFRLAIMEKYIEPEEASWR